MNSMLFNKSVGWGFILVVLIGVFFSALFVVLKHHPELSPFSTQTILMEKLIPVPLEAQGFGLAVWPEGQPGSKKFEKEKETIRFSSMLAIFSLRNILDRFRNRN